ncbi:hypothetical protein TWF173_000499 [Orbilia oligospora]|nr:hypothetical protein TWF173_000499 [Orbilia oligospora]
MPTPDRDSYTVGWICAIQPEYVAAQCFLDEKHGKPESGSVHINDNNHYTLGKIEGHNIVIAVLPHGEYGISSATAVIKDMLHSFPNIRIGLMVGIGGGAPTSKHDIRLGDIVVGAPEGGNGGVIQYDFGKTNQSQNQSQGQSFQHTGFLNQPPPILRAAIAGLTARHELDGHELDEAISNVLDRKPKLRKKYRRPDPSCDRLYKSEVIHPSKEEGCLAVCGDDPFNLVSRLDRTEEGGWDNPAIHYGLIASANQLMKNAIVRDRLATEKNILCFEMEAAGLMNQFPCLVIRGICDYSDSHKNKEWQGYAAMAAAAYAKDLLREVVPTKVDIEKKIAEVPGMLSSIERNVNEIQTSVRNTSDGVKLITSRMKSEEIGRWLSAPDPSTNYYKALGRRHEGSGSWFLESNQFVEWKTQRSSFLWLHGIPGCGKTILSSTIVENLESDLACQPLLYFYFDFTDTGKQTLENMLRALISQLYYKYGDPSLQLESLYSSCTQREQSVQPTCRSLCETFSRMVEQAKEVWLILDALDECSTRGGSPTEGLLSWMNEILNSEQWNLHLLATSRPENDIKSEVENFICINNRIAKDALWPRDYTIAIQSSLVSHDINAYIRTRVREENGLKRWRSHPEIQSEIETCLMEKANGMFRWAACQLDALENCLEYRSLQKTLNSLPTTLDETYARILRGIPEEHKQSALIILQFLTYSPRPLKIEEVIDAIAVDTETDEYFNPKYRMPNSNEVLCYCSGLVVAVPAGLGEHERGGGDISTELQLAHFSVKEYLASDRLDSEIKQHFQEDVAKGSIATICLAYLLHLDHEAPVDELKNAYPLAYYSARYWTTFAAFAESKDEKLRYFIRKLFSSYLHGSSYRNCYSLYLSDQPWNSYNYLEIKLVSPLYYASFEGLLGAVKDLLDQGADINAQGGFYDNALQAASYEGHEKIVEFLVNHGADANAQGGHRYYNALQAASYGGHEKIVELLLNCGADVNAQGGYYDNALQAASYGDHENIVELLLNRGADVNAQYFGALQAASERGHNRIIDLLKLPATIAKGEDGTFTSLLHAPPPSKLDPLRHHRIPAPPPPPRSSSGSPAPDPYAHASPRLAAPPLGYPPSLVSHRPLPPPIHHGYSHAYETPNRHAPPPPSHSSRARLQQQQRMQRTVSEPLPLGVNGRPTKDDKSPPRAAVPPAPVGPCQVCERQLPKLTCKDCTRDKMYPLRYEIISVLIGNEKLEIEVEEGASNSSACGKFSEALMEKQELENTITGIQDRVDELRTELEEHRRYLTDLKLKNQKRQQLLKETRNVLFQNKDILVEKVRKDTRVTNTKWNALYERTAESRVFLCREIAGLNLLRQRRKKRAVEYMLNGVVIPDIRQIYNMNPNNITVALGHLSHMSVLIATYLGLKLPCEVLLPIRDAPSPSIRNPRFNRARPLSTTQPLPQLHSVDSEQYAMFIEGVSMLVYNVAWLCWSQGLEEAAAEIEDVWQPGRNMYRLLLCTPTKHHQALVQWSEATQEAITATPLPQGKKPQAVNMFLGRVNHSSAHSFLNSPQGLQHMARWKITLNNVIDRTKHLLVSETSNAEWDLIENEIEEDPAAKFISELGEFREDDKGKDGLAGSPQPAKAIPISIKKGVIGSIPAVGNGSPGVGSPSSGSGKRSAINGGTEVSAGWTKLKR